LNNNLTLSVTLTGDGRQLSGTLRDAQGEVRAFGGTTEREGARAERALERTGQQAQTVSGHLSQLRNVAIGVGAALTAMGVSSFANDTYDAVSSSQQLQASLKTVTGSIQNASAAWDTLLGFAAETPFTLDQSVQAFIRMQSLGLDPSQEALRSYGNTAAAMGKDMMQMVEAVADATTGEFERLKEFGIRASKEGEQVSFTFQGVTTTVANSAAAISQYLQEIGELQFAGAMADQMDTLSGKASNLEDTIYQFYLAVGDAGATDVFEGTLANASNTVQFLTNNIDTLASGAETMAVLVGGRVAVALTTATSAMVAKTVATQADVRAEAAAAVATTRRTAAEKQTALALLSTARLEAQATKGTGAHTFALQQLSVARTRAATAAGTHTAAMNTATAATARASVAARGLSGALALIGGPLGLLVGGAGLLYVFREELGLTVPQVDANTTAVNKLTNGLDDMSQAAAQLTLTSLVGQLAEVRAQAEVTAEEFLKVGQIEGNGGGGFLGVDVTAQTDAVRELGETSNATQQEAANLEAAIALVEGRIGELGERNEEVTPTITEVGDASKTAAAHAKELAKSTQAQADALDDLYDRLIPGRRETIQLARDIQTLNLAIAMGTGNIAQNIQMMGLLQQQFIEAQNDTDDLADKTVKAAFTMEGAWDEVRLNGLRRLDDGFADLWQGAVDGSLNATDIMKRALDQTLAEMAHMAFTRPITVQMATSMGFGGTGAGGQQAAGSQSFGGMPSFNGMMDGSGAIANAYRAFQGTGSTYAGTFGSELAVQTQGGLKAGFESFANSGFGNTALGLGGGFIGSKLGGSVFGESQEQQIGATVGGIAGQVLIPIPGVGAAIGSFLGSGLGSLFGSEPTKFSGRFGTTASLDRSEGAGKDGVFEHQADGRFYRETALGYAGFRDQGTERLQRAGVGEDKSWAEDLVNATAAMDALTVSVARSDQEIATMRDTVQGLEASGRNAGEIIEFALKGRALAALESIGHTFSDAVTSLPAEEFTARMELMVGGIGTLMQSADRLNLQFDETASGALEAAGNIANYAGGVQNLSALQSSYFDSYTSEIEQTQYAIDDVTASFAALGTRLPKDKENLIALVEAQELNTSAGQYNYVQLLQLSDAYNQLSASLQNQVSAVYQSVLGREAEAEGLDYWLNKITSGTLTLEQAMESIASSAEAIGMINGEIADAYEQSLGRSPDTAGLEFWSDAVMSGTLTLEQALESIANSAEAAAYQTTQAMADALRTREQMDRRILTLQGNTEASREIEIQQLRAMQGAEEQGLVALQNRIWALEDAATAEQEAARAAEQRARAMEQAEQALANFTSNINNWLDQLNATDAGLASPGDQLAAASSAFNEQYQLALSGDRDALGSITQYASRFIDAQKGWSASGSQTAATIDRVTGMLETLPDRLSAEQFLAEEFRNAIEGQTETLNTTLIDTVAGGDLTEFADVISGQFASLDLNVDGFLTFNEMQAALDGKATDAEIRALIGAVDINGDGMISEMEALIAAESNGNTLLLNALSGSFNAADINVDGLLTFEEMKAALGPIASNEEIRNLISAVDVNGDGMISRQELTNARLYGLPGEISGALGTIGTVDFGELDFGRIDISTDGLLTFDEMQAALSGTATDAEIRNLISAVDVNGDGMISRQELAVARLGDVNTSVNGLGGLSGDIANALSGMFDDIADGQAIDYGQFSSALEGLFSGVASDQMLQSLFTMMDSNGDGVITRLEALKASGQGTESNTGATVETLLDQLKLDEKLELTYDGRGLPVTLSFVQDETVWGWIGNVIASKFGATNEHPGTLEEAFDGSHANGLEYVPFDGYRAELHKGEKVLTRADADLMRNGLNLPTANLSLPQFPTLGGSDVAQVLNDLKREVQQLRNDNKQLMEKLYQSSEQHKAVSSAGHQQSVAAQEKSAEQLKRMERRARLERAK